MAVKIPSRPTVPDAAPDTGMSLWEHLDELRGRLLKATLALVVGTLIGLVVAGTVLEILRQPYGREFTVLGPTGSVTAYFRVALMTGAMIASPLLTYQVMMFILPGLTRAERRYVLLALPVLTLLFLLGVTFAWHILIPPALGFLEGFQPTLFKPEWTADLYLGFVTSLVFWMGVAFETPLICFVLSVLGLITAQTLIRNWRVAVVIAAIAAAVITPTVDPVNLSLVMGPLLGLFVISAGAASVGTSIARRRQEHRGEPELSFTP